MAAEERPRYQTLADELSQQIANGDLPPGSPLPSVPELARTTGMSQTNVRSALQVLKEAGLVSTYQGRGTFVRVPRRKIRRDANERYNWEKSRAALSESERAEWIAEREGGIKAEDVDFEADYEEIEATPDLAADFKIVAGMPLLRRQYRTGSKADDTSLFLNRSYIPLDLVNDNSDLLDSANEPWPGGTLHQLRTVGIEVAQIVDEVTARPPTPDEARALDVESGTSVLVIRKTSIDTTGRVVEIAETILAGDRTELVYTTDLEPWT